ncbi:MAG: alpha/beta fold hydrolase [Chloroflexi bacterium]|nr:alpha/beta fold hydrolase [Chloroflexota bacterium]
MIRLRLFAFSFIALLLLLAPVALAQDDLSAAAEMLMASEPSFEVVESIVNFENEGLNIIGTLAMPQANEAVPLVLLFHGFKGERDELPIVNTEEGMFSRTARIFAERGIASLRIEFRGSGESEGAWEDTTFTGQVSDAIAALDFVETLDGIDPNRIGVLGLSQGGLVGAEAAGQDDRVKSLVLWSAAASPASNFANILSMDTIKAGLALPDGEALSITLPWGEETSMKRGFYEELFTIDPVAAITSYSGPLLVIVGSRDTTVYPMPQQGEVFLKYHEGDEAMVVLDGDHIFDVLATGPEVLDLAIFNSLAWFMETL